MVISVAEPDVVPGVNGAAPAQVVPGETSGPVLSPPRVKRGECPRCQTLMRMGYDEPECLNCGFADYTFTRAISPPWERRSIISAATRYVARYMGDSPSLTETLTHIRLVRLRNRAVYAVKCPFCDGAMDQSSLSGKRPEMREQRYKCAHGHGVSLVPRKNGMLGWR